MSSVPTGKRVCFVSSRSGFVVNSTGLMMDWANGRLIEELSKQISDFSVAIISQPHKKHYNFAICAKHVYPIQAGFSYTGGLQSFWSILRVLKRIEKENDILIVQLPFIGFLSLLFIRRPTVYHICANVLTAAENPVKYNGLKRIAAKAFANLINVVYSRIFSVKQILVLANGGELGAVYKKFNATTVISSSLRADEIINEENLTLSRSLPVRLFFVGRPSLEKGFDTLIEALQHLDIEFELTVVGFTQEEFKSMLPAVYESSTSLHEKFRFLGFKSWEEGLKDSIREQDIVIVPSRSEGTPRVILECMSQGSVVIASRVGGIPTIIEDGINGILVEPGDALDLRMKIKLLWEDYEWRKKLILCGLETAKQNTIEQFAGHFIEAVERLTNE